MPILTEQERLGTLVAGRYRAESILGRGGGGIVYEARHGWTGRTVALKILKPEHARDLDRVRRFMQEAKAAACIRHRHVVQVLDMGKEPDGTVYLVLERLHGESLGTRLSRGGALPVDETLRLLAPVMEALVVAHRQGVVHRDLKPDNIFIDEDAAGRRTPKLLDFGMSKMLDATWGEATQSGVLVGTPYYMSPEQAEGRSDQGAACDVWSMGVILYRCLSGELPFVADSPTALLMAIVQERPEPLQARAAHVPEAIAAVIDRALIADREQRFGDMEEMLDAVREAATATGIELPEVVGEASVEAPSFDPGPETRDVVGARGVRWWWAAAAAVALAVAVVALGAFARDAVAGFGTETEPWSVAETGSETVAGAGAESELETGSESESETGSETVAGSETGSESETVAGIGVVAEPVNGTRPRATTRRSTRTSTATKRGGKAAARGPTIPDVTTEW